jgi:hypothetical protein
MQASSASFLIAPNLSPDENIQVTRHSAGWDHLSFTAHRMSRGDLRDFETYENKRALVAWMVQTYCNISRLVKSLFMTVNLWSRELVEIFEIKRQIVTTLMRIVTIARNRELDIEISLDLLTACLIINFTFSWICPQDCFACRLKFKHKVK